MGLLEVRTSLSNTRNAKWLGPAIALVCALPLVYNSCQQFKSNPAATNSQLNGTSCRVMMENGRFATIRNEASSLPFHAQKVILADQTISGGVSRTQVGGVVTRGSALS